MTVLGNALQGLQLDDCNEEALAILQAKLSILRRLKPGEPNHPSIHALLGNISNCYSQLGRYEECLEIARDVFAFNKAVHGNSSERTISVSVNLANALLCAGRIKEAKQFLLERIKLVRRALGADHMFAIQLSAQYGTGLIHETDSSLDDRQEAVEVLESCERRARRVLGSPHPLTGKIEILLEAAREKLRTHNGG